MAERIKVLLTEEEVDAKIQILGDQISRDYAGRQVHLICVLKGGSFFLCELAKRITVPVSLDRNGMKVSKLEESKADVAYVTPSHQYPTGIVMPINRRMELLRWAAKDERRYIVEDD